MTTLVTLQSLRDRGLLSVQPAVAENVLLRIWDGFRKLRDIKPKFIDISWEQEVIE